MRLIINDILTETDKEAIEKGTHSDEIEVFDLSNLEALRDTLSERDRHFFECLSWLIRNEKIDIRIIAPVSGEGIAHTKCGVFADGISKVAFDGSVNFSRTALIDNKESLTASCSWDGDVEVRGGVDSGGGGGRGGGDGGRRRNMGNVNVVSLV